MTRARDVSWTLAFCASLMLHGGLVWLMVEGYIRSLPALIGELTSPAPAALNHTDAIFIPRTPDRMGQSDGKGEAVNSVEGDTPLQAPQAPQEQAFISRDPEGAASVGVEPSPSVQPPGENGAGAKSKDLPPTSPLAAAPPLEDAMPFGVTDSNPPSMPRPTDSASAAQTNDAKPGSTAPPADPAPMSDSESDPFSNAGSVTFAQGKVEARYGRKVKTVRPRLSFAAQADLFGLQYPSVILKVKIDSTGKVISVDILKTSGSDEVDLACQMALYDWWIEPPKDAAGHPRPDVMVWRLDWRS
ncbi:MAG: hypothetical protein IT446_12950 [Phycisphaerales bacterium]|nr:hypothetical protein [Phycisphaerales bacterium]